MQAHASLAHTGLMCISARASGTPVRMHELVEDSTWLFCMPPVHVQLPLTRGGAEVVRRSTSMSSVV